MVRELQEPQCGFSSWPLPQKERSRSPICFPSLSLFQKRSSWSPEWALLALCGFHCCIYVTWSHEKLAAWIFCISVIPNTPVWSLVLRIKSRCLRSRSKLKVWNERQMFDLYVIFTIVSILTEPRHSSLFIFCILQVLSTKCIIMIKRPFFVFVDNNWRSTLEN